MKFGRQQTVLIIKTEDILYSIEIRCVSKMHEINVDSPD